MYAVVGGFGWKEGGWGADEKSGGRCGSLFSRLLLASLGFVRGFWGMALPQWCGANRICWLLLLLFCFVF